RPSATRPRSGGIRRFCDELPFGTEPWRQITGIRHRLVHDYMDVDYDILWEVATRDLPAHT
ncbi:MAG: DUF86 domain-containing protein, partial [Deinococcales bacterium]